MEKKVMDCSKAALSAVVADGVNSIRKDGDVLRILHIAPNAPYNDYWGYQDNLLPKYHAKLNHDVTVIVPNLMHENGRIVKTDCADYYLNDGTRVIRLEYKKYFNHILTNLNSRLNIDNLLNDIKPEFVFFHGLVSSTILDVIKYKKKNPRCIIVCDNHLDYNIGMNVTTFKNRLIRGFHRHINKKSIKYIDRVYGVTPWRKTFAEDYFKIPPRLTDVLIMGADDEKIDFKHRDEIRKEIRHRFNVFDNDFLVVTGGKIDKKKKIDLLMKACKDFENVKLLVFGEVHEDIRAEFESVLENSDNINYLGWINSDEVYDYFFAADLVFFPGQHSVLWEQACASKAPCVFQRWEGMDHVDCGGNSDFIDDVTAEGIKNKITELCFTDKYYKMKEVAESDKTDIYLYSNIAKKSLEVMKNA